MAPSVSPVRSSAGNRIRNAQRQASSRARPGWRASATGSRSTASTSVTAANSRSRGRGGRARGSFMTTTMGAECACVVRRVSRFLDGGHRRRDRDTTMTRRGRGGDTAGRQWMGLTGGRVTERAAILGGVSRVLLIEDDPAVRQGLELALTRQGHRVRAVESGEQGLDRLRTDLPDVVVLDLMLPGMDGFEVCRRIRAAGEVPIIMLTARGDDMDVVAGLEAGADDYVVKPVQPRVLEARIRAVLRRGGGGPANVGPPPVERHGDLTVDRAALVVSKKGEPVGLAPTEIGR